MEFLTAIIFKMISVLLNVLLYGCAFKLICIASGNRFFGWVLNANAFVKRERGGDND